MEHISALMDGELDDHQARRELSRLKDDADLRVRWHEFHVVGDALRGERLLRDGFNERFSALLAQEPTVLAPRRLTRQSRRTATYALSAAASLAAVSLVAWVALAPSTPMAPIAKGGSAPAAIAAAPGPGSPVMADVAVQPVSTPSDGRMNEYLLAHQRFSPSTTFQGLAPYIRSVSTTRQAEGR